MKKKLVIGIITGIILLSVVVALVAGPDTAGIRKQGEKIALIYVEGIITGARGDAGLLGPGAGGPSVLEQLKEAADDDSIKAVLLRINSPGGSAAASQEIGDEIEKLRQQGKIVVASMGDVAASGGYWIAAKADRIVADPATMTGSIGVIMETANLQELFDKIGVSPQTIKSGPYKDIGSPNRPLTAEERQILQGMVDDIYQQFIDVVAEGRKLDRTAVLKLADGRIFTGRQALKNGLVDELGNYYHAVEVARKMAKIEGEPVIYEMGPRTPLERLLGQVQALLVNPYPAGLSSREIQVFREMLKMQPVLNR